MIVAAEAWERLTPATMRAVAALLRHNPRYDAWTAGLPSASRPKAAFIPAQTRPDHIKNAQGYYQDRGIYRVEPCAVKLVRKGVCHDWL